MDKVDLPAEAGVPASPAAESGERARDDVLRYKDTAALGYVWVLSVFLYLYRRSSPFVRFHAKQGMVLFALSLPMPFLPAFPGRTLGLVILGYSIAGFFSAARGQWRQLPVVYTVSSGDLKALRMSWRSTVRSIVHLWRSLRDRAGKRGHPQAELPYTLDTSSSPSTHDV